MSKSKGYRFAVTWLALNDDCEWLKDGEEAPLSVAAALVVDLFGKPEHAFRKDLARAYEREWGSR